MITINNNNHRISQHIYERLESKIEYHDIGMVIAYMRILHNSKKTKYLAENVVKVKF